MINAPLDRDENKTGAMSSSVGATCQNVSVQDSHAGSIARAPPRTSNTSRRRSPVAAATMSRWSAHGSRIVWSLTKGSRGNFGLKMSCMREPPARGRGLSARWGLDDESLAGTMNEGCLESRTKNQRITYHMNRRICPSYPNG